MITDIEVRGAKTLDPIDVKREVYDMIDTRARPFWQPARHALLLDPAHLEPLVAERLFAEHVSLERDGLHILRLSIQERSRRFVLRTEHQSLWVDLQGSVLEELTSAEERAMNDRRIGKKISEPSDPPIVSLVGLNSVFKPGEGIQDPRISTWLIITREIQKRGIKYREIVPDQNVSSTRITLKTAQGYNVWLDTSDTLETQIEAFKTFEKQKPKDVVIQEYVDVRIPNRIYVK